MRKILLAIVFISLLSVISYANSVSVTTVKIQAESGALTSVFFDTASGTTSATPTTNTALTPSGSSGSFTIPTSTSDYLWSTQFSSGRTLSSGNWVLDLWGAVQPYLSITLTNSQTSATPTAFQQMITWNPSTYSTYEASNLGNIRFCSNSACSTELYAWLESCTSSCTTSATSATAWVKLTSTIAASGGTLTIYMVFMPTSTTFDDNYWGEAPSLSTTYAQYDNGAKVFAAYFDGNTATSDFSVHSGLTVAQSTGVTGPGGASINAIHISGTSGAHAPAFVFNQALSNVGIITESSFAFAADTADATGETGLMNAATASGVSDGISVGMGDGSDYFFQAYDVSGTSTIDINSAGTAPSAGTWVYGSVTYSGTSATSWTAYNAPQLYSTTGGYSGTESNNPLSSATNVYLGAVSGSSAVSIYLNWDRARLYPPSGVMPSAAFGTVTSSGSIAVSIYVTSSTGAVQSTIASGIVSSTISSAKSEYVMTFSGNQVSIPINGYIAVVLASSSTVFNIYWGVGQPTNFQVPTVVLST